jgi:glycosidase
MKKVLLFTILFSYSFNVFAQKTAKSEVIYHLFQRSFYDSNGDSHGDLNGVRQKLDYLQDLGVTSILLLPLYDADCYHNYFANDFEKIDPKFGTMQDYIALVKDVHKRGMKLYLDMETQYVTSKHLWWKDAVGNLQSPYSDYLLFDDAAHTTPSSIIFDLREFKGYDNTTIKATTVNLKSPKVFDYNVKLFSYFLDPNKDGKFDDGVDGFRLDHAMNHLDAKPTLTDLFSTFWKPLIHKLRTVNPNVKIVAEQANWAEFGFDYFEKADVDRMFGFGLQRAILAFDKQQLIQNADSVLAKCPKGKDQFIFIENHDIDRFASLEKDKQKQNVAASLQLLIGGIPIIYNGQEIGMEGKGGGMGTSDGNDIPRREAFDWYTSGEGKGMALWYKDSGEWWTKQNRKANDGISLEEQKNDANSLFNYYKKLIKLRQSNLALAKGNYSNAVNDNFHVYSFYRTFQSKKVLVAVNLSNSVQKATFTKPIKKQVNLLGQAKIIQNSVELQPYEVVVWEVE